jgi:putative effector of murein hydrolase LrgA (UPF0299 family)
MDIPMIMILVISTLGIFLIPVGIELTEHSRRVNSTTAHGNICLIYGTLCGFVGFTGWINLIFY